MPTFDTLDALNAEYPFQTAIKASPTGLNDPVEVHVIGVSIVDDEPVLIVLLPDTSHATFVYQREIVGKSETEDRVQFGQEEAAEADDLLAQFIEQVTATIEQGDREYEQAVADFNAGKEAQSDTLPYVLGYEDARNGTVKELTPVNEESALTAGLLSLALDPSGLPEA